MHAASTLGAPNQQWRRAIVVAGTGLGVGCVAHHQIHHRHHHPSQHFYIPRVAVDALAGACGEFAQTCLLYPMETIKVRCQAESMDAMQVVNRMLARYGTGCALVKQLYSGFGAAAAFSIAVGAVHWLSFCAAKRTALDMLPKQQAEQKQHQKEHGTKHHQEEYLSSGVPLASATISVQVEHITGQQDAADLINQTSANAIAAMVGAFCTAMVESPIELFRHKAQAGLISGNLVQEMSRTIRSGGPLALWSGFLPFMIEAFPYDCGELGVYSQLRDIYDSASKPGSRMRSLTEQVPEHVVDLAVGGLAGAAAVILSMPFDCIKTYLQTRDMGPRFQGTRGQLTLFLATGARMVRRGGLGALYIGTVPRLAQQVPSSTVCWWAVQQTQKLLEPCIKPSAQGPSVGTDTHI